MPLYSFCVVFVLLRGVLPSSRVRSAVPCGGRGVRSCSWDWELSALTLRSRAASSELAAHAPAHLTPHSLGTILSAGLSLVARRAALPLAKRIGGDFGTITRTFRSNV